MAAIAGSKIFVGLTALVAGTAVASVEGCDSSGNPVVPAERVAEDPPCGESGLSLRDESAAVAAVQAHLSDAGVAGELGDVRLYSLGLADEVVVCATLPVRGAELMQIVARVVLSPPAMAARMAAPAAGAAAQGRTTMVILEAGPGLGRGGSQAGPGLRYCRHPQAAAAAGVGALPGTGSQAAPTGAEPGVRLVVISPARVRAAPGGSAPVLWTAPRGRSYVVLGHAPGGWVNIGDGEAALGWAHSSLLGAPP
jgi:hypothetical protein